MSFLKSIWNRFWSNPNTTLGGTVVGGAAASIFYYVANQAGCDLTAINWGAVIAFAGAQVMGGLATDNGGAA